MQDFFERLTGSSDFMPHGECLLWNSGLLSLHVVGDLLAGLAYYLIAAMLIYFVAKKRDLPYNWVFLLFCTFIFSCGTTHFMSAWTIYVPSYWAEGIIKVINAAISIGAGIVLFFLMPKIFKLPGLKNTLDALKIEKSFIETALDTQLDTFFVYEIATGKAIRWNRAFREISGYSDQEIAQKAPDSFYSKEDLASATVAVEQLIKTGQGTIELALISKTGHRIPMEYTAAVTSDAKGRPANIIAVGRDISDRKIAEQLLLKQRAEFQAIFNSIADGIVFVDQQRRIVMINPAFTKMFGYTLEEIFGKTTECLYADPEAFRLQGAQRYNKDAAIKNPVYEAGYRRKDGTVFTSETLGEKVVDDQGRLLGFLGVIRDISERKLSTERLLKEQARAQKYLDVAGVMLCALNKAGEITLINQQGCKILQTEERDALGKNWFDHFIPRSQSVEVKEVFRKILAGDFQLVEFHENEIVTANGILRTMAFHNSLVVDDNGDLSGVIFSGEDITERKHQQAEREKLEEQLRQAYKMEALGTMAGGIAHDFNNILAIILGNTDMALGDIPAGNPAEQSLEQVFIATNRAKNLVQQILAFSRKEKQEHILIKPQVLFKETLKLLRSTTPATVSIITEISDNCGSIMADPTQLHQLLMNLFSNALDAMNEKGEITVSLREVVLDREELFDKPWLTPGSYANLTLTDNGIGMDETTVKRIFDPFFTTKEVGHGTGMGLSVSHGIVENHGGTIRVSSSPGQGSTFRIFFPVLNGKEEEVAPETAKQPALPTGVERIIFVDDEVNLAELGKRFLEKLGYRITTMTSSVRALEIFQSSPEDFDLLITDQSMPEMSGMELIEKVRKIRPELPVIISTGYSSKVSAENAKGLGINAFCNKPLERGELAVVVRKVLDEKSLR